MDWFFDGLGTMLIGLVLGGSAGGFIGWRVGINSTRQSQRGGDRSRQTQVGRDYTEGPKQ